MGLMDVLSLCPLPAAHLLWQRAPARWALTVICKATFLLEPGTSALAPEQEPLNDQENHWDDDPQRSLFAPSDLVPWKPRADIVLVGSAFARSGLPVRSLVVRMSVGEVDKSIEVLCPRLRTRDGELREGKRWTKMPLLYERAAGGPDTSNPVGLPRGGPRDAYGQVQLPNLQRPGLVGDAPIEPIGFGPLAAGWSERKHKAPGLEAPHAPFGDGFDPTFFQVAPPDQQVDAIRPGERITLENLHPEHARLVTALPDLQPRALVEIDGAPTRELTLLADTLWIDTHRSICTVTYRAHVDLDRAEPAGRILVAVGKGDQTLDWTALAPPPAARARRSATRTEPLLPSPPGAAAGPRGADRAALPFQPAPPGWQPPAAISFGAPPPPVTTATSSQVSTQKVDMTGFRASLPAWLEATAPGPAPPSLAPIPPPPAAVPMLMRSLDAPVGTAPVWTVEPPRSPPLHEAKASPGDVPFSVLSASNAAASPTDLAPARPNVEAPPGAATGVGMELIWFDPAAGAKLASHPAFAQWKRSPPAKDPAPAPAKPSAKAPPVEVLSAEAAEALVRGHLYDALTKGVASSGPALEAALEASEAEGPPACPLVLVCGELELAFDETETLKAVVSAASPLSGSDKKLKEALDLAREMLAAPLAGMPEVAEGLGARIREAWAKANRLLPAGYLAVCTERALLEQRHYQRRELLDDTWIRALLTGPGVETPVPTYLPASIARRLPLFKRFPARLLGEVLWQQDELESHPIALRALALGRVPARGRRGR